jgi:hypothetical protein
MRSALGATEAAKAALQKQVGDLQEQLDEEKKQLTASVQELNDQKEKQEQEVADLQLQLVELASKCAKLDAMRHEVKQDVWALPSENAEMQASAVDRAQADVADADTTEVSDKKRCQQQAEDEEAQRPAKRIKVDAGTEADKAATSQEDRLKQQLALLLKKQPDMANVKEEPSTVTLSVGNMLHVEVCEANGLPAADPWGSSDPYCKVTFGSKTQSTGIRTKTLSPQWNQLLIFPIEDATVTTVDFQLWDSDLHSSDDLLGDCSYDISTLLLGIASEVTLPVSTQYSRDEVENSGQLKVVFRIVQP